MNTWFGVEVEAKHRRLQFEREAAAQAKAALARSASVSTHIPRITVSDWIAPRPVVPAWLSSTRGAPMRRVACEAAFGD